MNKLLVASRTRPDIDLPRHLGISKFSVMPLSLFMPGGSLHYPKDKVANSQITNCDDSAKCFTDMITNEIEDCDELWVGFDRYDSHSLKNNTRSNRAKGISGVHYNVSYTTRRSQLSLKQFLSSIITKNELTEYLSKKLAQCMTKEYVIVYGNSLPTNVANLNKQLDNYTKEEAGTSIAFHARDVTKRNPFSELVVMCSDTDVLLLLLHYFERISSSTIFRQLSMNTPYARHENLIPDIRKSLLGFHVLSGCDQKRKYPGYSKKIVLGYICDSTK